MSIESALADTESNDAVVLALLTYLQQHPQAADSLAGVARWWVGEDGTFGVDRVRRALAHLVDDGALRCERLPDGTDWYAAVTPPPAEGQRLH